jgi:hypothetical protein
LWGSDNEKVKNIVRKESQKYFSIELSELDNFLDDIYKALLKRR